MNKIIYILRHLPRYFFRCLLALAASSFVGIIYLIKSGILLPFLLKYSPHISYLLYCTFPIFISIACVFGAKCLPTNGIECGICEVEQADGSFLPSYLGYFFVALSIGDLTTFCYVFAVIWLFTYVSQTYYFNPVFLLLGYHFYFVTCEDGTRIFMITKQSMKNYKNLAFEKLNRINDFTFLDIG